MFSDFTEELRRNPFIRICLAFMVGILISLNLIFPLWSIVVLFAVSLSGFLFLHFYNRYSLTFLGGSLINIALISAGMFFTQSLADKSQNDLNSYKTGNLVGVVDADPKINDKTTTVKINIVAVRNGVEWHSTEGKTLLFLENSAEAAALKTGDKIVFSPTLSEIGNKGNPEEFDFRKYLSYNLILSSDYLSSDEWKVLPADGNIGLQHRFLRFRADLVTMLKKFGLNEDELAVASALALGYKDSLSDELRHAYSSAGAMHILAVSGLHVGIVYGIIVFLLSFFKSEKLRIPKVILTISLVWFYAALTGMSPSVSRAALMFTIIAMGKLQKHGAGSLNAVAASAFILLLINPYNLVNLGFQLSYIAVIGIIILYQPIYEIYHIKNKYLDKVWSLTAVSVAAQIATFPICLHYFHQFSNYFLLTNYLLIPVSTIAIWLVIGVFVFSPIPLIAGFVAKILAFVIKTMNFIASGIESLPFSVTSDVQISFIQMVLLYFVIVSFAIFFFNTKMYRNFLIAVAGIVVFVVCGFINDLQLKNQKYFIVYNINKTTAINVIEGKTNVIFATIDSTGTGNIEFTAKNNWLKKGLEVEKYVNLQARNESLLSNLAATDNTSIFFKRKFISFADLKVFVLDNEFKPLITDEDFKKMKIDYVILSNNPKINLAEIDLYFVFSMIIIDSSNSTSTIDKWLKDNETLKINIFDVSKQGAYVLNF